MRRIAYILIILYSLSACENKNQGNNRGSEIPPNYILKGTSWTSDFFHYHNIYYFVTDSTGYSKDGQYLWSTPVDPSLYNNSVDSIGYSDDDCFKYTLRDTILTLKYLSTDHDTTNDHRIFYLQKKDSNKIVFMSDYEYAYGHEYLNLKKMEEK